MIRYEENIDNRRLRTLSVLQRIVIDRKLKDVCLGRNKVAYLANEVESSISKDCPLETAKEESK